MAILKSLLYSLRATVNRKQALKKVRELERKLVSQQSRFAVPFAYRGSGHFKSIEPRQNPEEIEALYHAVCALNPQYVLEIGTAKGGTLYLWTQAAKNNATIVSVDLPGGEFGGAYPQCRIPFYQAFARPEQNLRLLLADSHKPETLKGVKDIFHDTPIDFAFIDGDHTYEGVKADFEQYGKLVRSGGMVAFHDILPRPDLPDIQVDKFWLELRDHYEFTELIGSEHSGRKIGIGFIRMK